MFSIEKGAKASIEGETCSGIQSYGTGEEFLVTDRTNNVKALLRYEIWANTERNINCLEAEGHPFLSTVVGRMRLVIERIDERSDFITFKTAMLRSTSPPHANLYNKNPEHYQETIGVNLNDYFSCMSGMQFGTKEEVLNRTGRERNEYCILFPYGDQIVPLIAFMVSRVLPMILSK